MFDIGYSELLLIAVVTLLVVGPKDLPRVLRTVGNWIGRARGMARHFRSGVDAMIRESELEEMNKQWAAQNAAIMASNAVVEDADEIEDRIDAAHRSSVLPPPDRQLPPATPEPVEPVTGATPAAEPAAPKPAP